MTIVWIRITLLLSLIVFTLGYIIGDNLEKNKKK